MAVIVLLDVDGVLGDFKQLFFDCAEKATGKILDKTRLEGNAYSKCLGLTRAQSEATWKLIKEPGAAMGIACMEGAQLGVSRLRELPGVELYAVTSPVPSQTWCYDRWKWLKVYFDIDRENVLYTHSKHLVQGDILVDDSHLNIVRWSGTNPQGTGILWPKMSWDALVYRVKTLRM